jgi:hypothetical protein
VLQHTEVTLCSAWIIQNKAGADDDDDDDDDDWWEDLQEECRLMQFGSMKAKIRVICELSMEIGSMLYILAALREARFLGLNMFIENLVQTQPWPDVKSLALVLWLIHYYD